MGRKLFLSNWILLYAVIVGYSLIILYYVRDSHVFENEKKIEENIREEFSAKELSSRDPTTIQEKLVRFSADKKSNDLVLGVLESGTSAQRKVWKNDAKGNPSPSLTEEYGRLFFGEYLSNTTLSHSTALGKLAKTKREKRYLKTYNTVGRRRPGCRCPRGKLRRKTVIIKNGGIFNKLNRVTRIKCICKKKKKPEVEPATTAAPTTTTAKPTTTTTQKTTTAAPKTTTTTTTPQPTTTPKPTTTTAKPTTTTPKPTTTTTEPAPSRPWPAYPPPPPPPYPPRPSNSGFGFGYGYTNGKRNRKSSQLVLMN